MLKFLENKNLDKIYDMFKFSINMIIDHAVITQFNYLANKVIAMKSYLIRAK